MEKRILHVTKYYPPYVGGTETLCQDTCHALENDFDQIVFAFNDKKETTEEVYKGIKVIRVGLIKQIASQPIAKDYGRILEETIRDFKPDIIHFDYPNPYGAHYLLKAIKKTKWQGKLMLFWIMDIVKQKLLEKLFRKQTIKLLKMAAAVQILSPVYTKNTSYLPYYDKKYLVLSPRVGDERLVITEKQKEMAQDIKNKYVDKKICFFFGRHVEYKGIKYLIEANKYIDENKAIIIIGGKGPLTESLKKQASEYNNIIFTGRLSDDEVNAYLLACDVFLFPSITRNEAYGISLAEALWFGKPSVTFTIPGSGVNWVSINNETGLEVENANSKEYANAINQLCSNRELYEKLSKGALERSHTYFSKERFVEDALKQYNDL